MHITKMIDLFSKRFEQQSHLSPLFRMNDYFISLSDEKECVSLHIRKRSCEVVLTEEVKRETIEIKGDLKALSLLVEGKVKLSELIIQGEIEMNAPFRTLLKLESIFYLLSQQSRDAV